MRVAVLREQRHLLLDDNHGDALLADLSQRLEDEGRGRGVERGGGLVEYQHARAHGENGGDGHLLLLSARERGYLAVAQVGDAHGLERLGNALLDLVVGDAKVLEAKEHLVLDHRGHHLCVDVLQDAAHHLRDVGERDVAGVVPVHQRGAVERAAVVVGDGARHHGGERGLSGARGANHAHELALANAQRHVAQRGVLAVLGASLGRCVVGERDVAHLDDGLFFPCGHKSLS